MRLIQKIKINFIRREHYCETFSLGDLLHKPQRLLVALPSSSQISIMCGEIISHFKEIFDMEEMKFASKALPGEDVLQHLRGYELYYPREDQPSKFGLPDKGFLAGIAQYHPQVAIDLDPTRDAFNSVILVKSGARARLGLARGFGLPFYNLELKPKSANSVQERIDDMYRFFVEFLNWSNAAAPLEMAAEA